MAETVYQKSQMSDLYSQMDGLLTMLDTINPEEAGVEEIDRIIAMLDDLENKCREVRGNFSSKGEA
ncbi:SE1561 family protein [Anaerobacillus sp. MEB173]|uniref:SE1561 family protein n=1 Tax=Anaerobacillus sp. MEB173 TaxID=3383345 RepID=UPI003F91C40E